MRDDENGKSSREDLVIISALQHFIGKIEWCMSVPGEVCIQKRPLVVAHGLGALNGYFLRTLGGLMNRLCTCSFVIISLFALMFPAGSNSGQVTYSFRPADENSEPTILDKLRENEENKEKERKEEQEKERKEKQDKEREKSYDVIDRSNIGSKVPWEEFPVSADYMEKCLKQNLDTLKGQPLEIIKEAFIKYEKGKATSKISEKLLGKNLGWTYTQILKLMMLARDREEIVPESWIKIMESYNNLMLRCLPCSKNPNGNLGSVEIPGFTPVQDSGQVPGQPAQRSGQVENSGSSEKLEFSPVKGSGQP